MWGYSTVLVFNQSFDYLGWLNNFGIPGFVSLVCCLASLFKQGIFSSGFVRLVGGFASLVHLVLQK